MTDAVILKLDTVLEITSELEEFYVDNLPYVISIAVVIKVLKGGECKRKGSKIPCNMESYIFSGFEYSYKTI